MKSLEIYVLKVDFVSLAPKDLKIVLQESLILNLENQAKMIAYLAQQVLIVVDLITLRKLVNALQATIANQAPIFLISLHHPQVLILWLEIQLQDYVNQEPIILIQHNLNASNVLLASFALQVAYLLLLIAKLVATVKVGILFHKPVLKDITMIRLMVNRC